MNPEVCEDGDRLVAAKGKRAGARLLRRLQESISESRMLQVLDRSLEVDRSASFLKTARASQSSLRASNQNQEEEEEEELVCVSTMVAVESEATQEEPQQRVCGVLKTVRHINRERGGMALGRQRENQSESAEGFK